MRPRRAKLPPGIAACYAITPHGLQILISRRLDGRRARIAMRAVELMVAQRWAMAVITTQDLAAASERLDRRLFGSGR